MLKRSLKFFLFTLMIVAAATMFGCGSDGDTGPQGPKGDTGPPGPPGIAATGAETCAICHGVGSIADIGVAHPDDPAFLGSEVEISNVSLTNNTGVDGGIPVVSFQLTEKSSGLPVVITDDPEDPAVDEFRFMIADLVPAGTETQGGWGTWDSDYWERWVYERTPGDTGYPQGTLDLTDAINGNYTYTFATEFGSATALADAPDFSTAHVQRLLIRFDPRNYPNITVDGEPFNSTQRSVAFLDFNYVDPAAPPGNPVAALPVPQRQFVTTEACEKCHSPNWERAAHAGGYRDTRACVICHSPLGFDTLNNEDRGQFMIDNDTYASVFFHKIHAAKNIPFWAGEVLPDEIRIRDAGYVDVTFPQHFSDTPGGEGELRDCVICHTDSGNDLGNQADLINNWNTKPSIEICGSCHDDIDFSVPDGGHDGGVQTDNTLCTACHPPGGGGVIAPSSAEAHDTTPIFENTPEFVVDITIDPPNNGTHYVEGEAPQVLVTLTQDGQPVDPDVYTSPQDAEGNVGGGLASANLYVYGPRAKAVPVLTTNSTTDPNWDPTTNPRQGHPLFVGSDSQVTTSSSGFSYQLLPIPADLEPGTYMVRFEGADYDTPSGEDDDYVTHSTALINFQVGTADEEFKVAGNACLNCHGDTRMHLQGAHPHNAAFDTDECLGCHDQSGVPGNFGIPIANRVHAVHSANTKGDIYFYNYGNTVDPGSERDWARITFPREISNCNTCHDSQFDEATNSFAIAATYKTLPFMMPCSGCHVGPSNDIGNWDDGALDLILGDLPYTPGLADHMVQNGGPWTISQSPDE